MREERKHVPTWRRAETGTPKSRASENKHIHNSGDCRGDQEAVIRTPEVKSPEWRVLSVPKAVSASLPPGAGRTFPQLPQKLTGSDNTPASRLAVEDTFPGTNCRLVTLTPCGATFVSPEV
uniref:Uncharacterized protein n=1 Tax=Rangifer tarandus platyrhynchus TaxID=3082113 RepID=A0ACB0FE10_RANTA|nr:unnamed protein product [Rangifer tarandus platyrhynchus]